ncbi:uncharacterized protein A4U43_C04F16590 [Asparagus officinalis]|uniref:Uncharacterized protein n=1 Tax=Asparagus officinalis TaxID=4686 RepID=A0A5P1F1E0_ASPOF|nr:uncharacterized protein A4U43_C04F16590 [Asparagus officinalis]
MASLSRPSIHWATPEQKARPGTPSPLRMDWVMETRRTHSCRDLLVGVVGSGVGGAGDEGVDSRRMRLRGSCSRRWRRRTGPCRRPCSIRRPDEGWRRRCPRRRRGLPEDGVGPALGERPRSGSGGGSGSFLG